MCFVLNSGQTGAVVVVLFIVPAPRLYICMYIFLEPKTRLNCQMVIRLHFSDFVNSIPHVLFQSQSIAWGRENTRSLYDETNNNGYCSVHYCEIVMFTEIMSIAGMRWVTPVVCHLSRAV